MRQQTAVAFFTPPLLFCLVDASRHVSLLRRLIPMKVFDVRSIPETARVQAQALYDTSLCTLDDIAKSLGLTPLAFRKARHLWGWPERPPRALRHLPADGLPNLAGPDPAPLALADKIEAQLGRELAAVEAMLRQSPAAVQPAAAAEKRARTIGSLVRALVELRRLDLLSTNCVRNWRNALISSKGQAEFETLIEGLSAPMLKALLRDWEFWARDDQLPPLLTQSGAIWHVWLMLGGRGAGKTRAGAEWVKALVEGHPRFTSQPVGRIALVGETFADVREVMIEGISGLLSLDYGHNRPVWEASRRRLVWPNGAIAQGFSAEDPESLRGPQFEAAWCDELAKWNYAEATWDMLQFGLRIGRPRQMVTTTPRPTPLLKKLMQDSLTVISRAKTSENAAYLAPEFLKTISDRYAGTRLGRQELDGDMIEEAQGALWSRALIESSRVGAAPALQRIVVAVDPVAASHKRADACGIVAAGMDRNRNIYVLQDKTLASARPAQWAAVCVALYHQLEADALIAEVNQGGEMVAAVIHEADANVPVISVRAVRGKYLRAAPVAQLYEQGRVHHIGAFPELEDEMCALGPGGLANGKSPDRLDALVWAITDLALKPEAVEPRDIYKHVKWYIAQRKNEEDSKMKKFIGRSAKYLSTSRYPFLEGFLAGFTAPLFFITSTLPLDAKHIPTPPSAFQRNANVARAWKNVGSRLSDAATKGHETVTIERRVELLTESTSGPLPSPILLQQYDAIIPNGAERIMAMAEADQKHIHEMQSCEMKLYERDHNRADRGQLFGFAALLAMLGCAAYLTIMGYQVAGGVLGGAMIVAIVTIFVKGKNYQADKVEQKIPEKIVLAPMSLFSRFSRRAPSRAQNPDFTHQREKKASLAGPLLAMHSLGRPKWTDRNYAALAREGFEKNAIVYRAVRMVAEAAASVPWLMFEGRQEITTHPLLDLLQTPNPHEAGAVFLETLFGHLFISGNAYVEAVNIDGTPRELYALRPDRMRVVPGPSGWPQAYEYSVGSDKVRFAVGQGMSPILHLKLFHPLDDYYGLSPLAAAQMSTDVHNAASGWNKALLDNAARPSGALVYNSQNGASLSQEQFDRLKAELEDSYEGARNAGRPLILEGGLDWKPLSMTPKDMDFMQAKAAAAREIALALGVPPLVLGLPGDNTFSNYQEANKAFWRQTVIPLIARTQKAFSTWMAPVYGASLRLDYNLDRIEALSADRAAEWTRLDNASFLTQDEKREAAGYGALPKAAGGAFIERGDLAHLALFLWASGASALLGYVLRELAEANRRFDELVMELARFNRRFGDEK
eukprot:gene9570-9646_t